jgi:ferric-dicitrate binding protein FerR (iron transport regulator)
MRDEKQVSERLEIDNEALRWLFCMERGHLSDTQQRQLKAWMLADVRHRGALIRARAASLRLNRLAEFAGRRAVKAEMQATPGPPIVILPPGYRLASIAKFLLTRKAFERFVQPVIADMQREYIDAFAAGHKWHARWVAIRGHLLVIPGWIWAAVAGRMKDLLRR